MTRQRQWGQRHQSRVTSSAVEEDENPDGPFLLNIHMFFFFFKSLSFFSFFVYWCWPLFLEACIGKSQEPRGLELKIISHVAMFDRLIQIWGQNDGITWLLLFCFGLKWFVFQNNPITPTTGLKFGQKNWKHVYVVKYWFKNLNMC